MEVLDYQYQKNTDLNPNRNFENESRYGICKCGNHFIKKEVSQILCFECLERHELEHYKKINHQFKLF